MPYRLKLRQCLAAHPLCGGIGGDQLRVQRFQSLQPLHEHIILIVGYHRGIQNIVQLVVIFKFPA